MLVPGRLAEAKTAGFSECDAGYHGYTCRRAYKYKTFKAEAEITLDGKPNFQVEGYYSGGPSGDVRELKPEQLSYRKVMLRFADGAAFLRELEADGWQRVERRRAMYYVKPGVSARWSVERHGIELEPVLPAEVDEQLAEDKRKLDEKKKLEDNASAVVKQLQ